MNTKRYLAAILTAVILSISFLACEEKEDDPTTNPTPTFDLVKEVHGFMGKTYSEVSAVLDTKGLIKSVKNHSNGNEYTYTNSDSTKIYWLTTFHDTVFYSAYQMSDRASDIILKSSNNLNKYLLTFDKWRLSFDKIFDSAPHFYGILGAGDSTVYDEYLDKDLFLSTYNSNKSTVKGFYYSNVSSNHLLGRIYTSKLDTIDNKYSLTILFIQGSGNPKKNN